MNLHLVCAARGGRSKNEGKMKVWPAAFAILCSGHLSKNHLCLRPAKTWSNTKSVALSVCLYKIAPGAFGQGTHARLDNHKTPSFVFSFFPHTGVSISKESFERIFYQPSVNIEVKSMRVCVSCAWLRRAHTSPQSKSTVLCA